MYIAPRQGRTTPWGQMLMSTDSPYHFAHLLQVLKTIYLKYDFKHILMILYMYIALGQGQTTHWGQTFDVNRKPLSLCSFVAGLKKIRFYIHFFSCFTICI